MDFTFKRFHVSRPSRVRLTIRSVFQHGCIYVHRNDKKDLERVERGIKKIQSNGLPVWLIIFPEGTRFNESQNPSAIERSKLFAKQKGFNESREATFLVFLIVRTKIRR